jgi:hypothetical protein
MMSGMPLETCWAFNKLWNNKFYYKVASCWLFLLIHTAMHGSMNIFKKIRKMNFTNKNQPWQCLSNSCRSWPSWGTGQLGVCSSGTGCCNFLEQANIQSNLYILHGEKHLPTENVNTSRVSKCMHFTLQKRLTNIPVCNGMSLCVMNIRTAWTKLQQN